VRIGRPLRVKGLAEATAGPAFSTTAGLLHFALSERVEVARIGHRRNRRANGLFGRLGRWLRENM
jgi:cell division protein FtsA